MTIDTQRLAILQALRVFVRQRPGLEYGNYGDPVSYRAEVRSIGRDLRAAETLIRAVELSHMSGAELLEGFRAYSGRLTWDGSRLDYCVGQYWPTEYRRAVAAVCAAALWDYYYAASAAPGQSAGDAIRARLRRQYGKRMQSRWFD
jgi:hypothetical protein